MEENYLHNTTRRNLYLALFPRCNAGPCGGCPEARFRPQIPGALTLPARLLFSLRVQATCRSSLLLCPSVVWFWGRSIPSVLLSSGSGFVLSAAIRMPSVTFPNKTAFVLCVFGQKGLCCEPSFLPWLHVKEGKMKEMCQPRGWGMTGFGKVPDGDQPIVCAQSPRTRVPWAAFILLGACHRGFWKGRVKGCLGWHTKPGFPRNPTALAWRWRISSSLPQDAWASHGLQQTMGSQLSIGKCFKTT